MSPSRAPRKRPGGEAPSPVLPKRTRAATVKNEVKETITEVKAEASSAPKIASGTRVIKSKAVHASNQPSTPPSTAKKSATYPRKPTLFDDLDGLGPSPTPADVVSDLRYLKSLEKSDDGSGDSDSDSDSNSDSELSSMSDVDFEDVPLAREEKAKNKPTRPEVKAKANEKSNDKNNSEDEEDDEDEDMEFEDVPAPEPAPFSFLSMAMDDDKADGNGPGDTSGDLELTLIEDARVSLTSLHGGEKKGPSKMERLVRSATHCVHVQSLLYHNAKRNAWLCDPEVQGLLLSHIPPRLWDEVDRWREKSGLVVPETSSKSKSKSKAAQERERDKGRDKGKGKAAKSGKSAAVAGSRPGTREWSGAAARLEAGAVDMSHGDPLFRLLRALSSWWRQKFRVTAPGMRKIGYMALERLDRFLKAAKDTAGNDPVRFGERIRNRVAFRDHAARLVGSRDVGAQLFTALLRALGLEARMVANLQPLGFGWNKFEDADPEINDGVIGRGNVPANSGAPWGAQTSTSAPGTPASSRAKQRPVPSRAKAAAPIVVDDSADDLDLAEVNSDNDSVIVLPEEKDTVKGAPRMVYDKDLTFPIYWTEVLSPVTQKYVPVDALVKHIVATNRELIESLEPRGAKADKTRQVMAYVVGHSADGTAKDVTVRYLKRQTLPGRTKGVRYPIEKIPVYNKHGKVRRYDMLDWFRQSVMRGYERGQRPQYPLTEVDEVEDSTDLKPVKPEDKEVKEGEETLQYYKQSKEFVLERHLKREEALVAGAVPVKKFRSGKKGKAKSKKRKDEDDEDDSDEDAPGGENVYLRKDVVQVKSAETWHKQGRAPIAGELPLKRVPYRAATTNRRREIAEAEAATGEKVLQGLYSYEQTDWIIPPPIENGVIPKNAYGNIDLFAEHMCPEGAVHVPYRGAMRVCKKMRIDFAEAVVDFEFGHRMAVPVIQGVVIAEEHHDAVMEALAKDEAERTRKADEKRRIVAMGLWRKMLMGLRIVERIKQDYGEVREDERVFGHRDDRGVVDLDADDETGEASAAASTTAPCEDMDTAGGFLPEGFEYEDEDAAPKQSSSSFFPVHDEDDESDIDGGGFIVE
ncbi:hypothetical protein SCUCBS95973_001236 [Sporothrix curviconia]|uniref:Xeroderma pigmentosum group C-complementing protein n=1 Tax=Sporothrix curviconia TaxID=1260050 RepID=A0ABP0AWZ5_9PEZI